MGSRGSSLSTIAGCDADTIESSFPAAKADVDIKVVTRSQQRVTASTQSSSSSSMGEDLAQSANTTTNKTANDTISIDDTSLDDSNATLDLTDNVVDHHDLQLNLAIELERRGKRIIHDVAKRKEVIRHAHLQGHFGIQAVFNKLWLKAIGGLTSEMTYNKSYQNVMLAYDLTLPNQAFIHSRQSQPLVLEITFKSIYQHTYPHHQTVTPLY